MTLTDKEKLEDEHVTLSLLDKIEGLLGEYDFSIAYLTNQQIRVGVIEIIKEAKCVRFNDSLLETKKETVLIKLIELYRFVQFSGWSVAVNADIEEIKKILITNVTFKSTIRYSL